MNNLDHIMRKRALYTGLQPFLKDTELMEALILWENQYANQPKYSLRYFIVDLAKSVQRESDATVMLLNLVATMAKPEKDLLPDPSAALTAYKKRRPRVAEGAYNVNEIEAFKLLIDKWLSLINSPAALDIERFASRNLRDLAIDDELKFQCIRWLQEPKSPFRLPQVELTDLRKIINLFYIGFCEYLGPNQADALLSDAVARLKNNGGAAYSALFAKLL